MDDSTHPTRGEDSHPHMREGRPTVRQVYALAAVLCERYGETFPASRAEASELIRRLRVATGHPAPRLDDASPRGPGHDRSFAMRRRGRRN